MKKTIIALMALAGVAAASSTTADLGNGITGTWTEYNMQGDTTTGTNSLTLPSSWGGPTSWITLDNTITLATDEVLTFKYTYASTTDNGIYGITFLSDAGKAAFMIGNTAYANRDLAAASTTLGSEGFYQSEAQAIRFDPGNSGDRIQQVATGDAQINAGSFNGGNVTVEIAYDSDKGAFFLTLNNYEQTLNLGSSVSFKTISFSADANTTQEFSNMSLSIAKVATPPSDNVPEPTTATLSLLALAGLAARRRRK